jgi:hypothetical protein
MLQCLPLEHCVPPPLHSIWSVCKELKKLEHSAKARKVKLEQLASRCDVLIERIEYSTWQYEHVCGNVFVFSFLSFAENVNDIHTMLFQSRLLDRLETWKSSDHRNIRPLMDLHVETQLRHVELVLPRQEPMKDYLLRAGDSANRLQLVSVQ